MALGFSFYDALYYKLAQLYVVANHVLGELLRARSWGITGASLCLHESGDGHRTLVYLANHQPTEAKLYLSPERVGELVAYHPGLPQPRPDSLHPTLEMLAALWEASGGRFDALPYLWCPQAGQSLAWVLRVHNDSDANLASLAFVAREGRASWDGQGRWGLHEMVEHLEASREWDRALEFDGRPPPA